MKKLLLFLLVVLCPLAGATGKSLSKRYTSSVTESGILYFLYPASMARGSESAALKDLMFDITYLSGDVDSVSFTATITTAAVARIDSVTLRSAGGPDVRLAVEPIYTLPRGSKYASRVRFYLRFPQWKALYQQPSPFEVDFGGNLRFAFKPKKWQKEQETVNQIINIIELNE